MVKGIQLSLILIFMVSAPDFNAQCDYCDEGRKGIVRAGAGLSLDNLSAYNASMFSGNGNLEVYQSNRVSIRGDVYLHLGNMRESARINVEENHQLLVGFNYHFIEKSDFDPYVGAQVGAAVSRVGFDGPVIAIVDPLEYGLEVDNSFNPISQFNIGFNYYAAKYFHLFMDASYQFHSHNTALNPSVNLGLMRFKFGLGWHINAKEKLK